MKSVYEEIIRIDDINVYIRINRVFKKTEMYFYSSNTVINRVELFVFDDYINFYVYEGNDTYLAETYPAYIVDLCEAVANVVKAHNNNEINLW